MYSDIIKLHKTARRDIFWQNLTRPNDIQMGRNVLDMGRELSQVYEENYPTNSAIHQAMMLYLSESFFNRNSAEKLHIHGADPIITINMRIIQAWMAVFDPALQDFATESTECYHQSQQTDADEIWLFQAEYARFLSKQIQQAAHTTSKLSSEKSKKAVTLFMGQCLYAVELMPQVKQLRTVMAHMP